MEEKQSSEPQRHEPGNLQCQCVYVHVWLPITIDWENFGIKKLSMLILL